MNAEPTTNLEPPPAPPASPVAELARLLEPRRGERHVVAIQDFPDPDAISSAMAYRELAATYGIAADIVYDGLISHPTSSPRARCWTRYFAQNNWC